MNRDQFQRKAHPGTPRRRRSYTINASFQWKYTLMTVATVFVTTGFMTIMIYNALHQQARARMMTPMSVSTMDNLTMIGLSAAAFALVVSVALTLTVFVFTHRIAGPMYVIGRSLEELAAGRLPAMRALRRTDEFKDVHDTLRAVVDRLREEQGRTVESMTELYNLAQTVAAGSDPAGKDLCDELLRRIDAQRNVALEALDRQAGDSSVAGAVDPAESEPQWAGAVS
jgi:methyl-accepting chemotaxis protein